MHLQSARMHYNVQPPLTWRRVHLPLGPFGKVDLRGSLSPLHALGICNGGHSYVELSIELFRHAALDDLCTTLIKFVQLDCMGVCMVHEWIDGANVPVFKVCTYDSKKCVCVLFETYSMPTTDKKV